MGQIAVRATAGRRAGLNDLSDQPCASATSALCDGMVTMFRGPRWKIAIYGRDHGIPHFHIEGPDFRCSVAIASFDLIVGAVPAEVLKNALEWAQPNQALLMQTWQELSG